MKKQILGGLAAAAMLAGGFAFTSAGDASATTAGGSPEDPIVVDDPADVPEGAIEDEVSTFPGGECETTRSWVLTVPGQEEVSHQEYQYSRVETTPDQEEISHVEYRYDIETRDPIMQDKIEKETRTRRWVEGVEAIPSKWWVWSPNNSQGPQDYMPNFPSDERGTWQGPKTDGGPSQELVGTFNQSNGNSGNSSWFHREAGTPGSDGYWGEWGPWTDWPGAGPLWDDGRDRGPAPHGSGNGWQRQYRYVVVDTRVTGYTDWAPTGSTEWSKDDSVPADTKTTRYVNPQSRTVVDQEFIAGFDTKYYFADGGETLDVTEANWTKNDSPGEQWTQIDERKVVDQEATPEVVTYYAWTDGKDCEPPTPEPPTPEPPTSDVAVQPPPAQVPTSSAPAPTATAPAAGLPATGSNASGVMALIALLVTSLGGATLMLARRQSDMTN